MQEASLDEDQLHFANFGLAEVDGYSGRARSAAEPRARSGRYDVDDLMAAIDEYDLIVDYEEAVVAVLREGLDQDREGRDRDDVDRPRNDRTGMDREVT